MGFTSFIDPIERRSMTRWLAFRSAPVFLSSLFLSATATRWGQNSLAAIVVMSSTHIVTTYARPVVVGIRVRALPAQRVSFWLLSVVLIVFSNLIGLALSDIADPLIPSASESVRVLWTGAFAAIVAGAVVKLMSRDEGTFKFVLFERSRSEIPEALFVHAATEARRFAADQSLVIAVMIVENLQRPKWLRRLENAFGRFRSSGTYGVMQVQAEKPITDEQSITFAIEKFFTGTEISSPENSWEKNERLQPFISRFNSNPIFKSLVSEALDHFVTEPGERDECENDDE